MPWYQEAWFNVTWRLLVLILPFVIGSWLATNADERLRLAYRAVVVFAHGRHCDLHRGWPPRLGIDLSGGVILVYEVDQSKASSVDLDSVVEQLRKDLSTAGIEATVNATERGVEVIRCPAPIRRKPPGGTKNCRACKICRLRSVCRIAPDSRWQASAGLRRAEDRLDRHGPDDFGHQQAREPGGQKEVTVRRMGADRVEVIIPQAEPAEVELIKDKISTAGALEFRILADPRSIMRRSSSWPSKPTGAKSSNAIQNGNEGRRSRMDADFGGLGHSTPRNSANPESSEPFGHRGRTRRANGSGS